MNRYLLHDFHIYTKLIKYKYYMPEWTLIRDRAFEQDDLTVYAKQWSIGIDGWSRDELMEGAWNEAKDNDPDIDTVDDYFDGYCYFTGDGLTRWRQGEGLLLIMGSFDWVKDDSETVTQKALIQFCEKSKIKYQILENGRILLPNAKPDPDGRIFWGDPSY